MNKQINTFTLHHCETVRAAKKTDVTINMTPRGLNLLTTHHKVPRLN